jgi:hypothetical protein
MAHVLSPREQRFYTLRNFCPVAEVKLASLGLVHPPEISPLHEAAQFLLSCFRQSPKRGLYIRWCLTRNGDLTSAGLQAIGIEL